MFKLRNKVLWSQWVALPLRLVIGFGFVAHGVGQAQSGGNWGPSGFPPEADSPRCSRPRRESISSEEGIQRARMRP